jgi:pimeloyl-ACP methyl ester carboxylesterase
VTDIAIAADGRKLSVDTFGASGEKDFLDVFLLHGTPGGRTGPIPRGPVLYRLGVRLISYDRPGYNGSDRKPGRNVADAAEDVATIADFLGIERFSVVGRSGGGPHALACAALLGDRVDCAAAISSLAPCDADGLDWYKDMAASNVQAYREATDVLVANMDQKAGRVRRDPESLLTSLEPELDGRDITVVGNLALRRLIAETHAEAVQKTAQGWIDDVIAMRSPWGFEPASIKIPVLLWHGTRDKFSPPAHTRWLASRITRSKLWEDDAAHFRAVEVLPEVLKWVVQTSAQPAPVAASRPRLTPAPRVVLPR